MKFMYNIRFFKDFDDYNSELNAISRKLLFLSILIIFVLLPISINAQSWLEEYNFRRALTINKPSGSTLADYQVKIILNTSNFNNNFPRANGEDIRITTSNGTTLLPFWIESWSSNQGVIWTKLPSIPTGNTTIYLYYGNNTVSSVSNGTNTFNLFEDNWVINPVQHSAQSSWETSISYPVVFKEGSTFYMLYDGHGFYEAKGLTTSPDLINWTPYANNPIIGFDKDSVDHDGNGFYAWGDIIKVGLTYHLFPSKGPGVTVHAQSTDLINWTDFTPLTTDDALGIGTGAAILKEGDGVTPVVIDGKYWMVYCHGYTNGDVYLAYSTNLTTWTKALINPILPLGTGGAWDAKIWSPSFIKIGNTYYIYYEGAPAANNNWQIGFASAPAANPPDQVTWTKNPVPVISGNHGWDTPIAIDPEFRFFDGKYYLFYTGAGGDNGFATSTGPEGPWSQSTNVWIKSHDGGLSTVSNGIISLDSVQNIQSFGTFSTGNALGYRASFNYGSLRYKWAGFIDGQNAPYLHIEQNPGGPDLRFMSNNQTISHEMLLGSSLYNASHIYEIARLTTEGRLSIDHSYIGSFTTGVPSVSLPINFQNLNDETATLDVDWVYIRKFSSPDPTITTVGSESGNPLSVQLKVFLEGPYNGAGGMTTSLNTNGLIPLNSNTAYSTSTYGYTASIVGSIPNSTIVDWVLVELRTGTASGTKVSTRAGFLKSNGTIVDVDGVSPLIFNGVGDGNYYVVVRHRNHLAIMSASAILLNSSSPLYSFSTAQSQAYTSGTDPMVALSGGGFGMIAADANNSAIVTAADVSPIIANLNAPIYIGADINMSAIVTAADVTKIISNLNKATNVPN